MAIHIEAATWQTMPSRLDDDPGFTYTPSPSDWRDVSIYQIFTDRFQDGDPANNNANPHTKAVNVLSPWTVHGGDFEGIRQKLDYLQHLGVGAIWILPPVRNVNGEYHGYAALDFSEIDPHWGGLADLRRLIDEAHARGMYVILDIVANHMGDLIDSADTNFPTFSAEGYPLRWKQDDERYPPPFDGLQWFLNHGTIHDWNDKEQALLGDFASLDSLRTEDPTVRTNLIKIYQALIAATDCDGFRVDTAKHVEMSFWEEFMPAIYSYASSIGKTNFISFAEVLVGRDEEAAPYTGERRFNSLLHFPMHWSMRDTFVEGKNHSNLTQHVENEDLYAPGARDQLVLFLDSHDEARILSSKKLNGDLRRLYAGLVFLYTYPGVPCLYYGTEQGFNGEHDPYNRETMFDGIFEQGPSSGDAFNMAHELFRFVSKLHAFRKTYPALSKGTFTERWTRYDGPGIYAYTRTHDSNEVIVAVNNSAEKQRTMRDGRGLQTSIPEGTLLVDLFNPNERIVVGAKDGSPEVFFNVPAYGYRIWVPAERFRAMPPLVRSIFPEHDTRIKHARVPLVIKFDQSMDTNSVEKALTISPEQGGRFNWSEDGTRMIFAPSSPWLDHQEYAISIARSARSTMGVELSAPFHSVFRHAAKLAEDDALGFVPDGYLDEGTEEIAEEDGRSLHIKYIADRALLYVATQAASNGYDRFIFIDDDLEDASVPHKIWRKRGMRASNGPFLADESEGEYAAWFNTRGYAAAKTGLELPYVEGIISLRDHFTTVPEHLYLSTADFETKDGGSLNPSSQLPASTNEDSHLDASEYVRVPIESLDPDRP